MYRSYVHEGVIKPKWGNGAIQIRSPQNTFMGHGTACLAGVSEIADRFCQPRDGVCSHSNFPGVFGPFGRDMDMDKVYIFAQKPGDVPGVSQTLGKPSQF